MTAENKEVVRRLWGEVWQKNEAAIETVIAPTFIGHFTGFPEVHGIDGFRQFFTLNYTAFPDLVSRVDDLLAEGDKVTVRYTVTGTHAGELLGHAPTGKPITNTGIAIYRVADGKIVEAWGESDNLGLLQQVGIVAPLG